jgi:hypothetical protein
MLIKVRLSDVMPPAMLAEHREHIIVFLEQEGIPIDPDDIGATAMNERQIKELLEEIASAQES